MVVRACHVRSGSFSDLHRTGNKHHRLSRLKVVSWGLLVLPELLVLQVTGIREVTISPLCWQEAVVVGTEVVALAGCPSGRDRDAIVGGGRRLWEAA